VQLRPTGSLQRYRSSAPTDWQIIPDRGRSPALVEERKIVMAVARNTKELER